MDFPALEKLIPPVTLVRDVVVVPFLSAFRNDLTDFVFTLSVYLTEPLLILDTLPTSEIVFFWLLSKKAYASAAIRSSFRSSKASYFFSKVRPCSVLAPVGPLLLMMLCDMTEPP